VGRVAIDLLSNALEGAYRADRWHALLRNLEPVTREEWDVRPARYKVEVFGKEPELSIGDLVAHVGTAKRMYANRAFGDGAAAWDQLAPTSRDRGTMLAWLEEGHAALRNGLAGLRDDTDLLVERIAHWGEPIPVQRFVSIMINHDLYHSGEINRQISLLRGATG